MAQYRDLNAPPQQTFAEIVAAMQDQAKSSKTGASGVKDLGESGDVLWETPSGPTSVRVESENMRQLGINLGELNEVILPELADDLDAAKQDLQQKLDAANARIDDIIVDGGGAGNFTTYSINEPTTEGAGEGDQWFRVVNGEVIGQWRWDGSAWQAVTLTDAIIAGIDLSKLVSNGNLSEVVANKMFADLFAANKITAQELAVGAVTAENIASGAIRADEIVGGSFTGETFEGGTFTGGLFKTSDALPGQVEFADDGYVPSWSSTGMTYPGFRVTPPDTSTTSTPPGIGAYGDGVIVDGGKSTSGQSSYIVSSPRSSFMRTFRGDGGMGGEIASSSTSATMTSSDTTAGTSIIRANPGFADVFVRNPAGRELGSVWVSTGGAGVQMRDSSTSGLVTASVLAQPEKAEMFSRAGGTNRYLVVDATGVWVKTGSKAVNLEGTTWTSLSLINGWSAYSGGGGYYNGLRAQRTPLGIRLDGMVRSGAPGSVIAVLPDDMQDVAAKIFTAPAAGDVPAFLEISTSTSYGGKYCLKYRSGPSAPAFVSVSTDAALL